MTTRTRLLGTIAMTLAVLVAAGCPGGAGHEKRPVGSSDMVPTGLGMRGLSPRAPGPVAAVPVGASVDEPPWKGGRNARVVIEEFADFE